MLRQLVLKHNPSVGQRKCLHFLLMGCAVSLLVSSCACSDPRKPEADKKRNHNEIAALDATPKAQQVTKAVAYLNPVQGNRVRGRVLFTQLPDGVQIVADIEGLKPGKHGFHIHEHGSCGGEEASEAGAHFNPTYEPHAGPDSPKRHVGDLGNLIADETGRAYYERIDKVINLNGEYSIVGLSVIVHTDEDDYTTQPAGASGSKISCGVIEAVAPD